MKQSIKMRRRDFLARSVAAGLGLAALPAAVLQPGRVLGANEKIVMGIIGSGGRGRNVMQKHIQNFLDCCRTRRQPNAPVEVGHSAVCGPHLANVAFLNQTRARLNADATKVYL